MIKAYIEKRVNAVFEVWAVGMEARLYKQHCKLIKAEQERLEEAQKIFDQSQKAFNSQVKHHQEIETGMKVIHRLLEKLEEK